MPYIPLFLSPGPLAQGSGEPKPHGFRTPPIFPSASGGLKLCGVIPSLAQDRPGPEGRTEGIWRLGPLCHGLWVENVQLFILCTQFVLVSSVLNKQAALPREGCPFIPTARAPCCGPRGYPGRGGMGAWPGHGYFRKILAPQHLPWQKTKSKWGSAPLSQDRPDDTRRQSLGSLLDWDGRGLWWAQL